MVSALGSRSSGLGWSPGRGDCVVFLGKKVYSPLHPAVSASLLRGKGGG